jgi:EAL domain-containing protein (putative c-di-GMP-specific phosphodiesterase class I)
LNGEGAVQILAQVNATNRYAFDQACRIKAIEMASQLGVTCELNINFLPNAVYEPSTCIRATLATARRTGFPLDRLTFEIVEHEDIVEIEHLRRIISEYKRQGFKVALDDFGTAYSGLHRLAELRPDILKLDRSLIMNCDEDSARLTIIASVARLCHDLNIKLVIEGVERVGEVMALQMAGARFMQGFYFAKPSFEAAVSNDAIKWPHAAV